VSEPYNVTVSYLHGMTREADGRAELGGREYLQLLSQIALVERLERLVAVLEQIRDRLPPEPGR